MSRRQALESERVVELARTLDAIAAQVATILDTIATELAVDAEPPPPGDAITTKLV